MIFISSIPKILFPSKAFTQKKVELLTSAAPAVMLALSTLTVYVTLFFSSRSLKPLLSVEELSPLLPFQEAGLQRMVSSLRPSVARSTCHTIEIVINQSVCLFSNQSPFEKKFLLVPSGFGLNV